MAGLICSVNSGEVSLAAATAKTVLQIKAPANQRVLIKALRILGKQDAGGTDKPLKVRATRSTANFGTGSAATPGKRNPSNGETVQTAAAGNFTVEPTTPSDSGQWWEVQPQSGLEEFFGPGDEIEIPGGQSWQLEMTSNATPVVLATVDFEE
jgi:hypothetical protein